MVHRADILLRSTSRQVQVRKIPANQCLGRYLHRYLVILYKACQPAESPSVVLWKNGNLVRARIESYARLHYWNSCSFQSNPDMRGYQMQVEKLNTSQYFLSDQYCGYPYFTVGLYSGRVKTLKISSVMLMVSLCATHFLMESHKA